MPDRINASRHIFSSPATQRVIQDAIGFAETTHQYHLPPPARFPGSGVYLIYYSGHHPYYRDVSSTESTPKRKPIYVGKAVPPGWRTARAGDPDSPALYLRLREHARSISQAEDLDASDFQCRFMILRGLETDLISAIESNLTRKFQPIWNSHIDGFGNHDPGSGRYQQARSDWDTLHPGRPWAKRCQGRPTPKDTILSRLNRDT